MSLKIQNIGTKPNADKRSIRNYFLIKNRVPIKLRIQYFAKFFKKFKGIDPGAMSILPKGANCIIANWLDSGYNVTFFFDTLGWSLINVAKNISFTGTIGTWTIISYTFKKNHIFRAIRPL